MWSDEEEDLYAKEVRDHQYWQAEEQRITAGPHARRSEAHGAPSVRSLVSRPPRQGEPAQQTGGAEHKARGRSRAGDRQEEDPGLCTLFVGNVPLETYENDLEELFEPYGKIFNIYIQQHIQPGATKTFGFVRFIRKHEAEKARRALNKAKFKGQCLSVETCRNPKDKEDIEKHMQKKAKHRQSEHQHTKQDEQKLWYLIETYTYLLAQSASSGSTLPDLGEFLNSVNSQENGLVPCYKAYDFEVDLDLRKLQQSFVENLSAEGDTGEDVLSDSDSSVDCGRPTPDLYFHEELHNPAENRPGTSANSSCHRTSPTPSVGSSHASDVSGGSSMPTSTNTDCYRGYGRGKNWMSS